MKQFFKIISKSALLAFLATSMIVFGEYLYDDNSPWWIDAIIVFLLFGIALTVSVLKEAKNIPLLELVRISNGIHRGETSPTTVSEFLEGSDEEALVKGDKVSILTNELQNYDLFDSTLQLIAGNLKEGVVYEYFLPLDNEKRLWDQAEILCTKLLEKSNRAAINNLVIKKIQEPMIYNFAIVEKAKKKKGYWYQSTKPNNGDAQLLIVEIDNSEKSKLENFFSSISHKNIPLKNFIFREEK